MLKTIVATATTVLTLASPALAQGSYPAKP